MYETLLWLTYSGTYGANKLLPPSYCEYGLETPLEFPFSVPLGIVHTEMEQLDHSCGFRFLRESLWEWSSNLITVWQRTFLIWPNLDFQSLCYSLECGLFGTLHWYLHTMCTTLFWSLESSTAAVVTSWSTGLCPFLDGYWCSVYMLHPIKVLKSPTLTVNLVIFPCWPIEFCLPHSESIIRCRNG